MCIVVQPTELHSAAMHYDNDFLEKRRPVSLPGRRGVDRAAWQHYHHRTSSPLVQRSASFCSFAQRRCSLASLLRFDLASAMNAIELVVFSSLAKQQILAYS